MRKKTHKQRLYDFFKAFEGQEVNHRRIIDRHPTGLGITEYSGRISDLRKNFGCTCGENKSTCTANEHIINTRKNYYKYICKEGRDNLTPPREARHTFVRPSSSSLTQKQAIENTKKRLASNPKDKFHQRLLEWQRNMSESFEGQIAGAML